jgi:putative heme-binding domain-containing protein
MTGPIKALIVGVVLASSVNAAFAQLDDATVDDYNQWKLALQAGGVSQPVSIRAKPGFTVEAVRVAVPSEGSWISLTFDPKGRAVIGREDKGVIRLTLPANAGDEVKVDSVEDTLLEPRGLLFAHDSLYVHANNSKALYRLRDMDGDDRFETVTLLRKTEGGVGHGRNGLALGPDGMIYIAMGNNVEISPDVVVTSPYRHWGLDRLLPCVWNEFVFDASVKPPAGHIVRTDAEGKTWEMFAGGFRNPYDLAFNADGELFTYDADMEWDAGAPWYRPTCVMHVVSGGEYGWRQGTSVWPDGFADSLPRIADIGLGSPTGVVFGTGTKFPEPYRSAVFVLDWAYGRIIAVPLTAKGASYTGKAETFVKGKPLNVTDAAVGPDGALYFTVGGRRTQSVLYRVRWTGEEKAAESATAAVDPKAPEQRARRRALEKRHGVASDGKGDLEEIWRALEDDDVWIRHAARVALERYPVENWRDRALGETEPMAAATALLALARVDEGHSPDATLKCLAAIKATSLDDDVRSTAWRAAQLSLIRGSKPSQDVLAEFRKLLERKSVAASFAEECLICELLVAMESPTAITRALELLETSRRQEEKLFALFVLRNHTVGWTERDRERYFRGLKDAEEFRGAQYMARYVTFIRTDALATLSDAERVKLKPLLSQLGKPPVPPPAPAPRELVQAWTLNDLVPHLDEVSERRDPMRGRPLFAAARCRDCHRLGGEGAPVGPDLAGAASRFSRRDLLETILHPSRVVDEKYRNLILETDTGEIITGALAGGDVRSLAISVDPNEPTVLRRIARSSIETRRLSPASPMPEGLLNGLTREEIFDLLAYLEQASSGK